MLNCYWSTLIVTGLSVNRRPTDFGGAVIFVSFITMIIDSISRFSGMLDVRWCHSIFKPQVTGNDVL